MLSDIDGSRTRTPFIQLQARVEIKEGEESKLTSRKYGPQWPQLLLLTPKTTSLPILQLSTLLHDWTLLKFRVFLLAAHTRKPFPNHIALHKEERGHTLNTFQELRRSFPLRRDRKCSQNSETMSQGKEAEIHSYRVECFGKPTPSAWPRLLCTVKIKVCDAEHSEYHSCGALKG